MCNKPAAVRTPLKCILNHWNSLDPENLKKKWLILYCTREWPFHRLGGESTWPSEGSLDFYAIQQLEIFCRWEDLGQIKGDLDRSSGDPDRYIEPFQNLIQVFDLTWRDAILLLSQTLTVSEKQSALQEAETFRDEQHISYGQSKSLEGNKSKIKEGNREKEERETVFIENPNWNPNDPIDELNRKHFLMYMLGSLRRTSTKPPNYCKLSMIDLKKDDNSSAFIERMREALWLLRSFTIASRRKPRRKRGNVRKAEALVATLEAYKIQNPQCAFANCYQCDKLGHFKRGCPDSKKKPPQPCPACGGDHWDPTVPGDIGR
ncbi:Natural cytotoxicity triggering receptor 3 ligand 1 [Plecturocebus cupreus]